MRLIFEVIRLALSTVRENKVRSFLTVLGVIIGTGSIIGVGSILAGIDGAVTGTISSLGTNAILIQKNDPFGGRRRGDDPRKPLTWEQGQAIVERSPAVEHLSPFIGASGGGVMRARYKGNDTFQLQFFGTDEEYANTGQVDIREGRFFTSAENEHRLPVCVLGEDIYKALFGAEDPIGKDILVAGHRLRVVGILNPPATSIPGQSNNQVIVPYFTMRKMFPASREHQFLAMAKQGQIPLAIDEIRVALRQARHDDFSDPDSFSVSTSDQLIEQFRSLTSMVAVVMVVLSSIGLLVGGIGVMNIMLVSVTERTREIGIRKAIGARKADIIMQFLTEAVVLTGLGGILGMLIGWGVSIAISYAVPSLPTLVPAWAVGLGMFVSVGIGLFFGIWPASKAARLDPVDALRYE